MVMSVFLTPLQRQPDDTSLYSVEGYCLDRSRSLVVERDGFLLLRFLLSLKRHDEKAETGSGILYRASRHPVASSTSQAGDAGTRYASLLQQGVSKMLDEEGLDEERKLRMQHWAKVAKDARALCLAVWFGVSANKAAEAY
ncbi:signal recognition, partial [Cystoisospora suis]